jgi:hypothetical protein
MIVRTIMHMSIVPDLTFQATDLARRSREVLIAARTQSGAIIRDKDGESLLVEPATRSGRAQYELAGLRNGFRVLRLLALPAESRDPVLYGELAWLAALPAADQQQFVWEYVRALEAIDATGPEVVEQLLYEWRQTARAWADEALRGELLTPLSTPLTHVEL